MDITNRARIEEVKMPLTQNKDKMKMPAAGDNKEELYSL
jgi:hypothetical protein